MRGSGRRELLRGHPNAAHFNDTRRHFLLLLPHTRPGGGLARAACASCATCPWICIRPSKHHDGLFARRGLRRVSRRQPARRVTSAAAAEATDVALGSRLRVQTPGLNC